MSQKSLHKRQDLELQATSFSSLPSDKHLWPRSYSEIRQEMHKSLQARLNREYVLRKPASFTKCELSAKHNRKMWVAVRKAAMNNALAQIKIEAKLKTLASRMKAEAAAKTVPLPISHIILPDIPKVLRTTSAPPISITEAMKDRDWLLKHRDVLQKTISAWINDSNGVRVGLPDSVEPYKYYIRKGNNSKLISQIMKNRTGWQKVKTKSEAHFVWSHRREMTFFRAVPSACGRPAPRVDDSRVVFSCPVKYTSPGTKAARTVSLKALGYSSILTSPSYIKVLPDSPLLNPVETRVHNRLENNVQLTHKKALFYNMKRYYTAVGDDYTNYLPLTFHISSGENDPEFLSFTSHFTRLASETSEQNQNIWIVKPGENSNQGRDIALFNTIQQIKAEIRSQINLRTGQKRTFIIQKYIERPFLYYKRKFDIRCYALITSVNGVIQGYYYPEGYLRTSSREFSLKHVWDKYTHLTNDAVQKNSEDYGKFEHGNKISYGEFQRYLDSVGPEMQGRMQEAVLPQMKRLIQDSIKASFLHLDPKRRCHCFEILGYDFMLDWQLRPILIEINTNPCLALVSPLLYKVIPPMVEGGIRLVLDGLFPELVTGRRNIDAIAENRWELIFHELMDGKLLLRQLQSNGVMWLLDSEELDDCAEEDEYDRGDVSAVG